MELPTGFIILLHVRPLLDSGLDEGARGAYANIAVLGETPEQAISSTTSALAEEGILLHEAEEVTTITTHFANGQADEEMRDLVADLSDEFPVQYYTFHNYFEDDS